MQAMSLSAQAVDVARVALTHEVCGPGQPQHQHATFHQKKP